MKATKCLALLFFVSASLFAQVSNEINAFARNFGKAPNVFLSFPLEGAEYSSLDSLALSAIAYDPDQGLDRVEFWVNGVKVGEDKTIPFGIKWQPEDFGTYHIKATAYDLEGVFSDSDTHTITFTNPFFIPLFWRTLDSALFEIPASFEEYPVIQIELDIKISPNPVRGGMVRVEVLTPFKKELARISIINNDGRLVSLKELVLIETDTTTIDVSKLPSGTYHAVVVLRDDIHSERFVLMND